MIPLLWSSPGKWNELPSLSERSPPSVFVNSSLKAIFTDVELAPDRQFSPTELAAEDILFFVLLHQLCDSIADGAALFCTVIRDSDSAQQLMMKAYTL